MNAVSTWYLVWILLTTIGFWLITERFRHYWLITASAALLYFISPVSLLLLSVLSTATIIAVKQQTNSRTLALIILTTLSLLVVKLSQKIFQDNVTIALPLMFGISFYTLRIIHLLVDSYLGKLQINSTREVLVYLFFPPIIAAGPIQRFETFNKLSPGTFNTQNFAKGLERLLHGCAMIIVLHNVFFMKLLMPWIEALANAGTWHPTIVEWISCFKYGMSLYLQFSGYSSIAIGFSLLLGYHLDENFNWPFLRTSLVTFWRNWHISLSSFCRIYIFTGTLAFSRSVPLAFIASMLAIGLWHSISTNFILWGAYHGAGLIATQYWLSSYIFEHLSALLPTILITAIGWVLTFNFVILGFAFTKHDNLSDTLQAWARIFGNS